MTMTQKATFTEHPVSKYSATITPWPAMRLSAASRCQLKNVERCW
jgi:hypothetical protein